MKAKTLLLNASYEPLRVLEWTDAIRMIFLDKVDVLEEHPHLEVRSVSTMMRVPSVLKLRSYVNFRHGGPKFNRKSVYERDNYICQYCLRKFAFSFLTYDHVIPKSKGGPKSWENIVTSCKKCNNKKGDRTPEEAGMELIRQPYRPTYNTSLNMAHQQEHYDWGSYLR